MPILGFVMRLARTRGSGRREGRADGAEGPAFAGPGRFGRRLASRNQGLGAAARRCSAPCRCARRVRGADGRARGPVEALRTVQTRERTRRRPVNLLTPPVRTREGTSLEHGKSSAFAVGTSVQGG